MYTDTEMTKMDLIMVDNDDIAESLVDIGYQIARHWTIDDGSTRYAFADDDGDLEPTIAALAELSAIVQ